MALFPRSGPVTQGQRLSNNLRTQAAGSGDGLTIVTRHVRDQKPTPQQPPPVSGGGGPIAFARYETSGGTINSPLTGWSDVVDTPVDGSWGPYGSYISYGGTSTFDFLLPCCVQVAFDTVVTGATSGTFFEMSTDCGNYGGIYDYIIARGTTAHGDAAGQVTYCDSGSPSIQAVVNSVNGSSGSVSVSGLAITIWPAPTSF